MARKAKDTPHLRLRIQPSLLARLEKSADKNGRTLTGEIIYRIEAAFRREDMEAVIEATAKRVSETLAPARDLLLARIALQKGNEGLLPIEEQARRSDADDLALLEKRLFLARLPLQKDEGLPLPDMPIEEQARHNEAFAVAALEKAVFEYDLKQLKERFPDTPVEEHVRRLNEVAAQKRTLVRGGLRPSEDKQ